jgi:hypothetical protein
MRPATIARNKAPSSEPHNESMSIEKLIDLQILVAV